MSYIRALSNPEAMYAYGSFEGGVYISSNGLLDRRGGKPARAQTFRIVKVTEEAIPS